MFRFKQFKIEQDRCAMKVCTDACLFGAWMADKTENKTVSPAYILDIGTGTGLLSLMIAQKSSAEIDAVEIDADAASQAQENISASPFHDRVRLIHTDIKDFTAGKKYDLIISNPPFFENQLSSPDSKKNKAMHSADLSLAELAASVKLHLSPFGKAFILLPFERMPDFENIITKEGFYMNEVLNISHSPSHHFFRSCMVISFNKTEKQVSSLSIKDDKNEYSTAFRDLLKDYYLNF